MDNLDYSYKKQTIKDNLKEDTKITDLKNIEKGRQCYMYWEQWATPS